MGNPNFFMSPDGTYITAPQLRFYLNRPEGPKNVKKVDDDFIRYLQLCRVYNLISDMIENDPKQGYLYWDDKKGCVSFAFPPSGEIDTTLEHLCEHWDTDFDNENLL